MTAPSSKLQERESPYPQNSFSSRADNMSASSEESSESVLRERGLFIKLVEKPISFDSRVTGGDNINMALPSGSCSQSEVDIQVGRDRGARGWRSHRHSASRFLSRSRSRTKSRSRSRSPVGKQVSPNASVLNISSSKSRCIRKWVVQGLSKDAAKSIREKYSPTFDGSFDLTCPKLGEAMARRWMNMKNLAR